jgi:hypothetical protein
LPASQIDKLAAAVKKDEIVDAVTGVVARAAHILTGSGPAISLFLKASVRTSVFLVLKNVHDAYAR